jgi:hypothetical protein
MLVPLTQLLRVIKVYFPLALPGPKGINVEITAQRLANGALRTRNYALGTKHRNPILCNA